VDPAVAVHHDAQEPSRERDLDQLQPARLDDRPDQRLHVHRALTIPPGKKGGPRPTFRVVSRFDYEPSIARSLTLGPGARYRARRWPPGWFQWSRRFIRLARRSSSQPSWTRTPSSFAAA